MAASAATVSARAPSWANVGLSGLIGTRTAGVEPAEGFCRSSLLFFKLSGVPSRGAPRFF